MRFEPTAGGPSLAARFAAPRDTQTRGATIALAIMALIPTLVSTLAARPAEALPAFDPGGDAIPGAFQTYDITSIDAVFNLTNLIFTVQLAGSPIAPSANANQGLSGFIDIDADANPNTGVVATIDLLGPGFGSTNLGIEYYIDLFTEAANPGFVSLKDPINVMNVSQVPIVYGANSITITVALNLLVGSTGLVNYAVAVGDAANVTDQAKDPLPMGGLPASSSPAPIPEPGTAMLVALGLAGLAARRRT